MVTRFTSRARARLRIALGRGVLATTLLVANFSAAQVLTDPLARSFKARGDDAMGNAQFGDAPPIDPAATLKVNANVLGARLSVDGSPIGQVPFELRLPPGTHRVHLEHSGYESNDSQVVLGPGEQRLVQLSLQKTPPFYMKWWFWTGVGTAAAVATVTMIAIKSEKSADTGDIPPGTLAAPLLRF